MLQVDLQFEGSAITNQVIDRQGSVLGVIREFLIDVKNGRVIYALLDTKSAFSTGQLLAIPWRNLVVDRQKGSFMLSEKIISLMEIIGKAQ